MPLIKPIRAVVRPAELPPGCRLYAPLLERSGSVTDSARGTRGVLVGSPSWSTGPWGQQLSFPLGSPSGVNFGSYLNEPNVSAIALVQAADIGVPRTLWSKRVGANGWQFYRGSNNTLAFRAGGSIVLSAIVVPVGQYLVLGVSFASGSSATFYSLGSGGLSRQRISITQSLVPGLENLWLGAFQGGVNPENEWVGPFVAGLVADTALSDSQMSRAMHDLWTGSFQAIRPNKAPLLLAASLSYPPPPPTETGPSRAIRVKWFPGLSRRIR